LSPIAKRHSRWLVRCSAAIALSNEQPDRRSAEILVEAIADAKELIAQSEGLRFNRGNLVGYAARVVRQRPFDRPQRLVAALCQALEYGEVFLNLELTRALLDLVIGEQEERRHFFKGRPLFQLAPLQREALGGILRHGWWYGSFWRTDRRDMVNGNYVELMKYYGLPTTQEALRAYLRA
jgi:hypothetical protein